MTSEINNPNPDSLPADSQSTDFSASFQMGGLPQVFAAFGALLSSNPEPDRAMLRRHILEGLEAAPPESQAALLTREGLLFFLEASKVYLRVRETRTDAEAPTIQERLSRLVVKALDGLQPSERGALVMAAVPSVLEFSLLCELFRLVEGNWAADRTNRPLEETYFGLSTDAVRDGLFARVRTAAKNGSLWTQGSPTAILWFWWACGEEQRVYAYIKECMGDAKALPALLDEIVYRVKTPDDEYDVIPVRRWSKLIDFNSLEKAALNLSLTGQNREDRKKARRFLDAFGNGKSELYR